MASKDSAPGFRSGVLETLHALAESVAALQAAQARSAAKEAEAPTAVGCRSLERQVQEAKAACLAQARDVQRLDQAVKRIASSLKRHKAAAQAQPSSVGGTVQRQLQRWTQAQLALVKDAAAGDVQELHSHVTRLEGRVQNAQATQQASVATVERRMKQRLARLSAVSSAAAADARAAAAQQGAVQRDLHSLRQAVTELRLEAASQLAQQASSPDKHRQAAGHDEPGLRSALARQFDAVSERLEGLQQQVTAAQGRAGKARRDAAAIAQQVQALAGAVQSEAASRKKQFAALQSAHQELQAETHAMRTSLAARITELEAWRGESSTRWAGQLRQTQRALRDATSLASAQRSRDERMAQALSHSGGGGAGGVFSPPTPRPATPRDPRLPATVPTPPPDSPTSARLEAVFAGLDDSVEDMFRAAGVAGRASAPSSLAGYSGEFATQDNTSMDIFKLAAKADL